MNSATAFAEYRVFSLIIVNQKTQTTRQIQSTLDPQQYKSLFPLNPDESIGYIDTWKCMGSTGSFKPPCEKPNKYPLKNQEPDRSPASN